jgi:predicted  nucleic acid-binding Zn-ribbon protein
MRGRLAEEHREFQQETARLTEEGRAKSEAVHVAEKELIRREAELQALRGRLDDANQKYRASTEQVAMLMEHLAHQEAGRQSAEAALAHTQSRLEKMRAAWPKSVRGFNRKLPCLSDEGSEG